MPVYDFTTHKRKKQRIIIKPAKVIIVEGILIYTNKRLRKLIDIELFIDTKNDIQLIRHLQRDAEERGRSMQSVISQYLKSVKPMKKEYIKTSKKYADLIIYDSCNPIAADMISSMFKPKIIGS